MKQIFEKEFPPSNPAIVSSGESFKYFSTVANKLERAGHWEKIADDYFVAPFAFRPNNLAVYSHTNGASGAVVLKVERTIKPFGNHEHDYFTVRISAPVEIIGELEKDVLKIISK